MSLKMRFQLSLQTIVIGILILVELQIIILQIVGLFECKQCLLFASIFEVKRILEGGFSGWCLMVIANGVLSIFISLLMLIRHPILGIHLTSMTKGENLWMMFCITFSNITTTCFMTIGWHHFCNSFEVVRCHLTSSLLIDWKSYTPKYSNCYNTYYYYIISEMGLWWCSASWIYLFLTTYRKII